MMEMMRQARDLQKQMKKIQKRVEKTEITATAGDNEVTVVVNGKLHVRSVEISPNLVARGDVRQIQQFVTDAVNAALARAQEIMAEEMKQVTGGLNMPDMFG
jgi:hypothetical protein